MKAEISCQLCLDGRPDAGFLKGVKGGGADKRRISQKENVCGLWYLDTATSFRCVGLGPMCEPMQCDSKAVCVCFLRRCFPLIQHKSTVNFLNTSYHTVHWLQIT